jgi:glucokinase
VTVRQVGLDVGGTKCLGLAVGPDGEHLGELRVPTPNDPDELVATLASMARELGATDAVGVGVPGLVNHDGVLLAAPNVTSVRALPLRARLEEATGLRVVVDNDNTVACLAEWRLGAGRGAKDMILVGIGTGIGGGQVCGGRLQRGAHGFAGEFGHFIVEHDGIECPCGQRGCWERYASGSGLGRWARKAAADGLLDLRPVDGDELRGEDVTAAALAGGHEALAVVDTFAGWVALGLLSLTNIFDPEVIVLAGGVSAAPELFLPPIERRFEARLFGTDLRPKPDIRFAELGPYAGAVGAALLTNE